MKKLDKKMVELLVKEAIWDYIKATGELKGTDFDGGISCEFKSFKETDITEWMKRKIKKYKLN